MTLKLKKLDYYLKIKEFGKVVEVIPKHKLVRVDITPLLQIGYIGFILGLILSFIIIG